MKSSEFEIHNYAKLDAILADLCQLIVDGQESNKSNYYGMVAACVLDPENNKVSKLNYLNEQSQKRVHAERAALEVYTKKYGEVPRGSIVVTTLSPCNEDMDERDGDSCTDLLEHYGVKKVYCGYIDPTQQANNRKFALMETANPQLRHLCKKFADTFLKDSKKEPTLPELLKNFFPIAMEVLGIKQLPEIQLEKHLKSHHNQATFGRFVNHEHKIYLAIANRHPIDILRTLAHELTHYKQWLDKRLTHNSGQTGSPEENQAHAVAGVIMRIFNKKYPNTLNLSPLEFK